MYYRTLENYFRELVVSKLDVNSLVSLTGESRDKPGKEASCVKFYNTKYKSNCIIKKGRGREAYQLSVITGHAPLYILCGIELIESAHTQIHVFSHINSINLLSPSLYKQCYHLDPQLFELSAAQEPTFYAISVTMVRYLFL